MDKLLQKIIYINANLEKQSIKQFINEKKERKKKRRKRKK